MPSGALFFWIQWRARNSKHGTCFRNDHITSKPCMADYEVKGCQRVKRSHRGYYIEPRRKQRFTHIRSTYEQHRSVFLLVVPRNLVACNSRSKLFFFVEDKGLTVNNLGLPMKQFTGKAKFASVPVISVYHLNWRRNLRQRCLVRQPGRGAEGSEKITEVGFTLLQNRAKSRP